LFGILRYDTERLPGEKEDWPISNFAWMWSGTTFVRHEQLFFEKESVTLSPYVYQLPQQLQSLSYFQYMIEPEMQPLDLLGILKMIREEQQNTNSDALTFDPKIRSEQVRVAARVIDLLYERCMEGGAHEGDQKKLKNSIEDISTEHGRVVVEEKAGADGKTNSGKRTWSRGPSP
jgi:hypothetical protein